MKDTANAGKFQNPKVTADGQDRAHVALSDPQTLWFNTGTLCNITCANCYIESSPENDRLVYITKSEVEDYLDQLEDRKWGVREIAFTGGEPFMNPQMIEIARASLSRGYEVLILTNAMRPMMRQRVLDGLTALQADFGDKLTLRISLDHHDPACHDAERGAGAYEKTLHGMRWLRDAGVRMAVAGRSLWHETDLDAREGYAALFKAEGFDIDAQDPGICVLFPEMDETVEVPEITTACWGILDKQPTSVMCSSSRMVVKRRGAEKPAVLACTLLPYDAQFELGETLADAEGAVPLNHPHCAKFCVLGGASCSA
ncbi:putative Fe-S cluster-containing radical SAM superfamily protein [Sagittula marina]|uniref:Putative Fe-S cluster-containing radical SAM superfamily protein n=1 Tax=Sagittula marina TaxID=943940 RepID=A0A7W6GST8_9RHOB|nr:radical SAM protein [Sagittula marina]MBB3986776.1 putative Fe-S cluster-containing radical SAM superfamily protein [Sagittula marina]